MLRMRWNSFGQNVRRVLSLFATGFCTPQELHAAGGLGEAASGLDSGCPSQHRFCVPGEPGQLLHRGECRESGDVHNAVSELCSPTKAMLVKLGYGKGGALNQRCPDIFTILPFLWIDGNLFLWAELAPWLGQGRVLCWTMVWVLSALPEQSLVAIIEV